MAVFNNKWGSGEYIFANIREKYFMSKWPRATMSDVLENVLQPTSEKSAPRVISQR